MSCSILQFPSHPQTWEPSRAHPKHTPCVDMNKSSLAAAVEPRGKKQGLETLAENTHLPLPLKPPRKTTNKQKNKQNNKQKKKNRETKTRLGFPSSGSPGALRPRLRDEASRSESTDGSPRSSNHGAFGTRRTRNFR